MAVLLRTWLSAPGLTDRWPAPSFFRYPHRAQLHGLCLACRAFLFDGGTGHLIGAGEPASRSFQLLICGPRCGGDNPRGLASRRFEEAIRDDRRHGQETLETSNCSDSTR